MYLPNVIIAGVRKCGTTSVFEWLSDHPSVGTSTVKETTFLMDKDSPYFQKDSNYHDHGLGGYEVYFAHCKNKPVIVEATTRYIYQNTARDVLSRFDPQPHVVFILREPSDRLYSAFRYAQNNRCSIGPDVSFGDFVTCIREGRTEELHEFNASERAGKDLMNELSQIKDEINYGQYIDYLLPWKRLFHSSRLHVYLFENLRDDPRGFIGTLAEDIGIGGDFYADYCLAPKNQTLPVKCRWLHRTVRKAAPFLPRNRATKTLYRYYASLQRRRPAPPPCQDREQLAELDAYYRPYDLRLAEELDLDLSPWHVRHHETPPHKWAGIA